MGWLGRAGAAEAHGVVGRGVFRCKVIAVRSGWFFRRGKCRVRKGRAKGQKMCDLQARPDVFDAVALTVVLCVDEPSS